MIFFITPMSGAGLGSRGRLDSLSCFPAGGLIFKKKGKNSKTFLRRGKKKKAILNLKIIYNLKKNPCVGRKPGQLCLVPGDGRFSMEQGVAVIPQLPEKLENLDLCHLCHLTGTRADGKKIPLG